MQEEFTLAGDHGAYLKFRCITVKLKDLDARKFTDSKNVVARLCLPFMKHAPADKHAIVDRALDGLIELESDPLKREKYLPFIVQYSKMEEESELEEFAEKFASKSHYGEQFMSMYDLMIQKGVRLGKEEGRAEGMAEFAVRLFRRGMLTAAQARQSLKDAVAKGEIPAKAANAALKKMRAK